MVNDPFARISILRKKEVVGQPAAGPPANYFFEFGMAPGSLLGGTMFFIRR
jgi:hypothetical protein